MGEGDPLRLLNFDLLLFAVRRVVSNGCTQPCPTSTPIAVAQIMA